jgi:eukaryotic-like serine/threonine-protein kinase
VLQNQRLAEQRDRAISEQHHSDEVTQFLVNVFKAADPAQKLGRDTPIGKVVDLGRAKVQDGLKDSPEIRSRILLALAEVYASIDDNVASHALAAESLDVYEHSGHVDQHELINYLNRIWQVYLGDSTPKDGLPVINRAVALHDALGDSLSTSWRTRVNRLKELFAVDEPAACNELTQLVEQLRNDPNTQGVPFATAAVTTERCAAQPAVDREKAIALVREGVDILSQSYSPEDPDLWSAKGYLARMLANFDRPLEALPLYEELVAEKKKLYGSDSTSYATQLVGLGALYADLKRTSEAESGYLQALSIFERLHGEQAYPDIAATSYNLAEIYDDQQESPTLDERARKADQYYTRALEIATRIFGPASSNLAALRFSHADFRRRHGDKQTAKQLFSDIVPTLKAGYRTGLRARYELARLLLDEGKIDEARKLVEECEAALAVQPNNLGAMQDKITQLRTVLSSKEAISR